MVDDNDDEKFWYMNAEGEIEYVTVIANEWIVFYGGDMKPTPSILIEDIPKMIKALQAAYDYSKK